MGRAGVAAVLFLSLLVWMTGCHTVSVQPSYRFREEKQDAEVSVARRHLGESPDVLPGDAVRGMLFELSGGVSRLAEQGMCVACLPADIHDVILLLPGGGDVKVAIPPDGSWETPAGSLPSCPALTKRLLSEVPGAAVKPLMPGERSAVREFGMMLKIRYGDVRFQPLVLSGTGLSRGLAGVLLRAMFSGHTLLAGGLPAGAGAARPGWSETLQAVSQQGWRGERVSLPELTVTELCRRLGMRAFGLSRRAVTGARLSQPPERLRVLTALSFVETPETQWIASYGREHGGGWKAADVFSEVLKSRPKVVRSYAGELVNAPEQSVLLWLARDILRRGVSGEKIAVEALPNYSERFLQPYGCSVTLYREGEVYSQAMAMGGSQPFLVQLLKQCARLVQEPSKRLTAEILSSCKIEVGVMSLPRVLSFKGLEELCGMLRPGRDGLVLRSGGRSAGFIPAVWRELQTPEAFVSGLFRRAGLALSALESSDTRISVFEIHSFREP